MRSLSFKEKKRYIMAILEKLWKIWENIEMLNKSQQKQEGFIYYHNQIITGQIFSNKFISNRNE